MGQNTLPLEAGALGVQLFFALSGFHHAELAVQIGARPAGEVLRRFYIGRAVRLMPAYYLTLLVPFMLGVPDVHDFILWPSQISFNFSDC